MANHQWESDDNNLMGNLKCTNFNLFNILHPNMGNSYLVIFELRILSEKQKV